MSQLSEIAQNCIDEEVRILAELRESLILQRDQAEKKLQREEQRARELTAGLVATRRAEDRVLLASDEAVSHGMRDQLLKDIESIERLLPNPYFARLVVEEENSSGPPKTLQYFLGHVSNSQCRIIDWKNAPISKLYYEYEEDDTYCEEILGVEREGSILTRNALRIKDGRLQRIQCREGTFEYDEKSWKPVSGGRFQKNQNGLPDVLSLITPDQFRMITEEQDTAVFLHGIAGSGKTTVALYRLSWLIENKADLEARDCVVLVLTPAMKQYIASLLELLGSSEVPVKTYQDWTAEALLQILPEFKDTDGKIHRPLSSSPSSIGRVKRSTALLSVLEESLQQQKLSSPKDAPSRFLEVLAEPKAILQNDSTGLITENLIRDAEKRTRENFTRYQLDPVDQTVLLRILQNSSASLLKSESFKKRFSHIILDEAQDFELCEIDLILNAVNKQNNLTIVGDTAQRTAADQEDENLPELLARRIGKTDASAFFSLEVSHRSTLPILQFAAAIQRKHKVVSGRDGRVPLLLHTRNEDESVHYALSWIGKAMDRYPDGATGVLCRENNEVRNLAPLLQPQFGSAIQTGVSAVPQAGQISLMTIEQAKGLEFDNVLIWNSSKHSFPDDQLSQSLLYIGITRARENLCLIAHGKLSPLISPVQRHLIRKVRVGEE